MNIKLMLMRLQSASELNNLSEFLLLSGREGFENKDCDRDAINLLVSYNDSPKIARLGMLLSRASIVQRLKPNLSLAGAS